MPTHAEDNLVTEKCMWRQVKARSAETTSAGSCQNGIGKEFQRIVILLNNVIPCDERIRAGSRQEGLAGVARITPECFHTK